MRLRSIFWFGWMPAFMQPWMKGALMPKKVVSVSSAIRHSASKSG